MAVTPRAVGSGLKGQAYRHGGGRDECNTSQVVGADSGDGAGVGSSGRGKGASSVERWWRSVKKTEGIGCARPWRISGEGEALVKVGV